MTHRLWLLPMAPGLLLTQRIRIPLRRRQAAALLTAGLTIRNPCLTGSDSNGRCFG
jgi:hypothetical protein